MVKYVPRFVILLGPNKAVFIWQRLLGRPISEIVPLGKERDVLRFLVGGLFDELSDNLFLSLEKGYISPFGRVTHAGYQEYVAWHNYRSTALKLTDIWFTKMREANEALWGVGGE